MEIIETAFEKRHAKTLINGKLCFLNPRIMYKLGFTKEGDSVTRFTEKFMRDNNYKYVATEIDFNVDPKWSAHFSREEIRIVEAWWEKQFPKNIWTTVRYTGSSEYRYIPDAQAKEFIAKLHKKWPSKEHPKKKGYYKLYFNQFIRKEKPEDKYDD